MYGGLQRAPIEFLRSAVEGNRKRTYMSGSAFDQEGCLLAVGDSVGVLDIYDFEHAQAKWLSAGLPRGGIRNTACFCENDRIVRVSEDAAYDDMIALGEQNATIREGLGWFRPLGSPNKSVVSYFDKGFAVQKIRWNPRQRDEIAVCSRSKGSLKIYDLASSLTVARREFPGLSTHRGVNDITFMNYAKELLVGAAADGSLPVCDLRAKKLSARVQVGKKHLGRTGVLSVHTSTCGYMIYSALENGQVFVHDLRNTAKELISNNIFDGLRDQTGLSMHNVGVSATQIHRDKAYRLSFQLNDSSVGTFDILAGTTSRVFKPLTTSEDYIGRLPEPQIVTCKSESLLCYAG
jgi:WD40 repeat protein